MYALAFFDAFALEVMAFNCIGYVMSGEKVLVYGYSKKKVDVCTLLSS